MQVHEPVGGVGVLGDVHELPAELLAVPDVVRAAAPLEVLVLLVQDAVVARAHVGLAALGAGLRHRVGHAGGGDGGQEGGFSATCNHHSRRLRESFAPSVTVAAKVQ